MPLRQKNFDGATKGVSSLRAKGEQQPTQPQAQKSSKPGSKQPLAQVSSADGVGTRVTQPKRQLAPRQADPSQSKLSTFLRDSLKAMPDTRDARLFAEKPFELAAAHKVKDPQSAATTPLENLSRSGDTEEENLGNGNYMESAREDMGVGNLSINTANLQIKQPNPLSSILTMHFNNSNTNFSGKPQHPRSPASDQQRAAPKRSPRREVKFKLVGGGRQSSGPAEAMRPTAVKTSPNKQSRVSMVPQVKVGARRERAEPVFEEENCLPSDSHRKINMATLPEREPTTFMLSTNKCNSESNPQVVVGRESSNIVDDDSVNRQVHETHGGDDERLTVKKAAEGDDSVGSEEQEAGIEDDDNPWAFDTTQARHIGTTLKTA